LDYKRCTLGLWDTTVPGITFDENGVSNYAKMFDELCKLYPRGTEGKKNWEQIIAKIKHDGINKKYDCVIGVSGGTDSSYLLHMAKIEYGLRPLAVNLDNGWSSEIAVKNIKKVTKALDIDLETYVIDYEEIKDLLRSYMMSSLPWIDIPTDLAIKSILFKIAKKEKIRYILRGNDFRSEGFQPHEWTYGDGRQLIYVHKTFGKVKLHTFPNYSFLDLIQNAFITKTKSYFPFYYLDYNKQDAQKFLIENFDWEYYGGHHHENVFTKFAITYWLYEKFGIDKRIITLSAQILSSKISYDDALGIVAKKPYDIAEVNNDIMYVLKKLELSNSDFDEIMSKPNKLYTNYPSYFPLIKKLSKPVTKILKFIYPYKPMSFVQMEMRDKNELSR
jgi:N-acetyl sugar amidotransferase